MIDYDAPRAELAQLNAWGSKPAEQNPGEGRGLSNFFGPAREHNAQVWKDSQARNRANIEARKQQIQQMLAAQQSDPYGGGVRALLGDG